MLTSQAEKEAAEAAANAARLIEQKRLQLAQVQSQGGKAKAAAASACGTKRKQSAAALSDNSNVAAKTHSEQGTVRPHLDCTLHRHEQPQPNGAELDLMCVRSMLGAGLYDS